jgi:hypothetical protein
MIYLRIFKPLIQGVENKSHAGLKSVTAIVLQQDMNHMMHWCSFSLCKGSGPWATDTQIHKRCRGGRTVRTLLPCELCDWRNLSHHAFRRWQRVVVLSGKKIESYSKREKQTAKSFISQQMPVLSTIITC